MKTLRVFVSSPQLFLTAVAARSTTAASLLNLILASVGVFGSTGILSTAAHSGPGGNADLDGAPDFIVSVGTSYAMNRKWVYGMRVAPLRETATPIEDQALRKFAIGAAEHRHEFLAGQFQPVWSD